MRTTSLFAAAILGCAAWLVHPHTSAAADSPNMQTARHFKYRSTTRAQVDYLLYTPKGYSARSKERWPLILFLHGAGERGTNLSKVAVHGPPKRVQQKTELPFIIVSPQCPEGQIWSANVLLGLLDEVVKKYHVDTNRVYLTGLSMGGYGTWDLGLTYPERFAAIVPICGGGELIKILLATGQRGQALRTLGVWAFHGGKDPVVPTEESERMVNFLKKVGVAEVKLTVYPEAGHDSWTETYNNPELYEWFLQHSRKPQPVRSAK